MRASLKYKLETAAMAVVMLIVLGVVMVYGYLMHGRK